MIKKYRNYDHFPRPPKRGKITLVSSDVRPAGPATEAAKTTCPLSDLYAY
jgi:hypothetical protein